VLENLNKSTKRSKTGGGKCGWNETVKEKKPVNENMWEKAARGRAEWAMEWGTKHNKAVCEAGKELSDMVNESIRDRQQIIKSSAYIICTRLYHREVLND